MADAARKLAMQQPPAFLARSVEEADCGTGYDYDYGGYGCGYGCEFGDGEDSGYTEIPAANVGATGSSNGGFRDRVSRFVFRTRQQQPPLPHLPQPSPPPAAAMSAQPQRRRVAKESATFAGYGYTRWAFQPAAAADASARSKPSSSSSCSTPPPLLAKSASARTVRFRCPYDDATESALIQPYLTREFSTRHGPPPSLPAGPIGGDRSASSGYGSDMDAASSSTSPGGGGGGLSSVGGGDHWAVREEDIDRLLFASRCPTPRQSPRRCHQQPLSLDEADDLDVKSLDLAAFFPPTTAAAVSAAASTDAADASQIDRIVGDVVRLKAAATGRRGVGGDSPWRQQRRDFATAVAASTSVAAPGATVADWLELELTDLRPAGGGAHSYDRAYYCQ